MSTKVVFAGVAVAALVLIGLAYTQSEKMGGDGMQGMNHPATGSADASDSTKSFEQVMAKMMAEMSPNYTGKPDADFVAGMIPHHQGAIEMAKVELQFGKDAEIRKLAEGVIKMQEGEIAFMKDWQAKTDQAALASVPESTAAFKQAMGVMMKDMMAPYSGDADTDFARGMVAHHQGAIDMAKVALQYGKDLQIRKLAGDVLEAQEGEIAILKDWLAKNAKN